MVEALRFLRFLAVPDFDETRLILRVEGHCAGQVRIADLYAHFFLRTVARNISIGASNKSV